MFFIRVHVGDECLEVRVTKASESSYVKNRHLMEQASQLDPLLRVHQTGDRIEDWFPNFSLKLNVLAIKLKIIVK